MLETDLLERFHACRRYKQARPWQKPFLNPVRFLRNQCRRRGLSGGATGSLEIVDAFHLPRLTVVLGEAVSAEIAAYGIYEERLTEAFLRLARPGQTVVDIGMHLGYYTALFARLVGPQGAVHAFEPTPSTREIAQRNVAQFKNVTVHASAVWSSAKVIAFHDYGLQWMAFNSFTKARMEQGPPEPTLLEVPTTSLDLFRSETGRAIDLLKIDAESAEQEILRGAEKMLASDQPLVSLEVGDAPGENRSRQLIDSLEAAGFRPWAFAVGRFSLHEPKEFYEYDNLIFAPKERDLSKE